MKKLPETTRVARLLDIIWRISNQPKRWTRARLAREFDLSERTITDDLTIIRERLLFEVLSERGRGYYFKTIPQLPSVTYSLPEAIALVLAAYSARQLSGISQPDLAAAIARLALVIPSDLQPMIEQFANTGGIAPQDEHRQHLLAQISQAVSMQRQIDIVYAAASSAGMETQRIVDPYAVIPYVRSWHMVAYCHLREDMRIFKLDRIRDTSLLQSSFEPDAEFDLGTYLNTGWGLMRGIDTPTEDITLIFSPPSARWVGEEHWHRSQQLAWREDGSLVFRLRMQITPEFQRWVFRYGRDVTVREPEHLKIWIANEARATLQAQSPSAGTKPDCDAHRGSTKAEHAES